MNDFTPEMMCFGLSRELDMRSFSCFLRLAGRPTFADALAARISSDEMEEFVAGFTGLLKRYFSEDEYHALFLGEGADGAVVPKAGEGER